MCRTCHGVPSPLLSSPVLSSLFLLAPAVSLISSCPPLLITLSCSTSSHISLSSDHLLKNEKNYPVFQLYFSSPSIFIPSVFLFQHLTVFYPLPFHFSPRLHSASSFLPHVSSAALCFNTTRHCLKRFSKIRQPFFVLPEISLSLSPSFSPTIPVNNLFLFNLHMMTAGHRFMPQSCHSSSALLTSNLHNSTCVFSSFLAC